MTRHRPSAGTSTKQQPRKKGRCAKPPETPDEYLAEGVALEESAEKWRAGDAVKATRFFNCALIVYDEALARFPDAFDIVYNKARVIFSITQHPKLLAQASNSLLSVLHEALEWHRRALDLDPTSPDVQFNTAQVLSSIAEVFEDDENLASDSHQPNSDLYGEAVRLLGNCLARQEQLYARTQHQQTTFSDEGVSLLPEQASTSATRGEMQSETEKDAWATVEEPTTKSSLIETGIALMESIASYCSALDSLNEGGLTALEARSRELVQNKLSSYLDGIEYTLQVEHVLARANLEATFLEAGFRIGRLDHKQYDSRVKEVLAWLESNIVSAIATTPLSRYLPPIDAQQPRPDARVPCFAAETLINFCSLIASIPGTSTLRWNRLGRALEHLKVALNSPHVENLSAIHQSRGDVELHRFFTCREPDLSEVLRTEEAQRTLLENAKKYYRGAAAIAKNNVHSTAHDAEACIIKEAVAAGLLDRSGQQLLCLQQQGMPKDLIRAVLKKMGQESVVPNDALAALESV